MAIIQIPRGKLDIGIDVLRDVIAETQFDGDKEVSMKTVEEIVLEAVEASEALFRSP